MTHPYGTHITQRLRLSKHSLPLTIGNDTSASRQAITVNDEEPFDATLDAPATA